jgi:peptide/nickel transport system substrate-binding protein
VNGRDRAIAGVLVALLIVLGVAIAVPNAPAARPVETAEPTPAPTLPPQAVYREGVVGTATSITPVTARTRAERTLVGLVFSGLVKLGPGTTYKPDLAEQWTVDPKGKTWTFTLRDDAVWQDGEPVTSADVVYTIQALQSPDVTGSGAAAWADVTVEAPDERTVVFRLGTPVAGFLAAALQPLLPEHLLADVPFADLATSEFAAWPVGSGPYAISVIDDTGAVLVPTSNVLPGNEVPPTDQESPSPTPDSLATPLPPPSAVVPTPYIERMEIRFFEDQAAVVEAYQAREIDAVAGLTNEAVDTLAAAAGTERLRYPTTTLSTVLLNLRPSHPELRDPRTREALLMAIDRDALVRDVLGGNAVRADALVPPGTWAYEAADPHVVPYDPAKAAKLLATAGWTTKKNGTLVAPDGEDAYTLELVTVTADASSRLAAVTEFIRDSWTKLGMTVDVLEVPVADLAPKLREGDFAAAVIDIAEGLEPDLYPLLASTQVRAGGSNLAGYQDPPLDELLEAARKPGTDEDRATAWKALLDALALKRPLLPLAWNDEVMLARGLNGTEQRLIRATGDRYWDVLAWRLAADR